MRYDKPVPTDADVAEANRLLEAGYYQVSSAHRTIARLPTGYTGRQALAESAWTTFYPEPRMQESQRRRAWQMDETAAADQFLRVYAETITLTPAVWVAYKQLGGKPIR